MHDFSFFVSFIFFLFGNEFTFQIVLAALPFLLLKNKRSLFYLRFSLCLCFIIGSQHLLNVILLPVLTEFRYILVFFLLVGTCALSFKINFQQALFLGFCIYASQHIFSNASYILLYSLIGSGKEVFTQNYYLCYCIIAFSFSLLIPLFNYFILVRKLLSLDSLRFNQLSILFLTTIFALVATMLTYFGRNHIGWWNYKGLIYFLLLANLFSFLSLYACFNNIQKKNIEEENKILREILHRDKQHYQQAKLAHERIQIKYHDIKKYINQGIIEFDNLKELDPDGKLLKTIFYTGNKTLDVILSEKALQGEYDNIQIICSADGTILQFMKPYHLYSLLGNAIDNAMECLRQLDNTINKEILLSIYRQGNTCVIKISNYAPMPIVFKNGLPTSNKNDPEEHGYGTKSMKSIIERYNGFINFYQEENSFVVLAIIPIPNDLSN